MTITAPAKINLSLRITGCRDDGFHELETLVLPLPGLADELIIEKAEKHSLTCSDPSLPTDEDNLVTRAIRLFEERAGVRCPVRVHLEKQIPHGAGLGGGSSDAASAMRAINELSGAGVAIETLAEWAAELGSDIPLFFYQSACWCRGRGELIEPVDLTWTHPIVLFKPAFGIPTPWAYSRWRDSREVAGISYEPQDVSGVELVNDLERPVFEKHRFLAELKHDLLNRTDTMAALMSGSGSTVFAVLKPHANAQDLAESTLAAMDPTMWHAEVLPDGSD